MKIRQYIRGSLQQERERWILWFPVLLGTGVAMYYSLPFEPPFWLSCISVFVIFCCRVVSKLKKIIVWPTYMAMVIGFGFFSAHAHSTYLQAPILEKNYRYVFVEGTITNIDSYPNEKKVYLNDLSISRLSKEQTPYAIRLVMRTDMNGAEVGDRIAVKAHLKPPPIAVLPGEYHFARYAYFRRIGAVGYSVTAAKVVKKSENKWAWRTTISNLRKSITSTSLAILGERNGSVASAFLVGERRFISEEVMQQIRSAGLSHLLAISGMHLAMVAALSFFLIRLILACFPKIALHYPIKKYAAFFALVMTFGYLLLTGMPISAQRAYIMVALVLIAILVDREGYPMRYVAMAAVIMLLVQPHTMLQPGFQMSFAAVIALIALYEVIVARKVDIGIMPSFSRRFLGYFGGILISSIVAQLAVTPFALYHFNQLTFYGAVTNLVAIPVMTFLLMPSVIVVFLFMPFGLETLGFIPMGWGIDVLLWCASTVSGWPFAFTQVPSIPTIAFASLLLGGLWLCLWKTKWRVLGFVGLVLGTSLSAFPTSPDLVVSGKTGVFAFKHSSGAWVFSDVPTSRYLQKTWLSYLGQDNLILVKDLEDETAMCIEDGCQLNVNGKHVLIARKYPYLKEHCYTTDILINLTFLQPNCLKPTLVVNRYELRREGTHALWLGAWPYVESVSDSIGRRPWGMQK